MRGVVAIYCSMFVATLEIKTNPRHTRRTTQRHDEGTHERTHPHIARGLMIDDDDSHGDDDDDVDDE